VWDVNDHDEQENIYPMQPAYQNNIHLENIQYDLWLALPILLAVIGIIGDLIAALGKKVAATGMTIALVFTSVLFFSVFNQREFDYNGYDLSLLIHNGNVNYFSSGIQKKWIDTYRSVSPANKDIGKKVYAPGLWGHWILVYALFGDLPPVFKRLSMSGTINQSKIRYQYIAEAIANDIIYGKDPDVSSAIERFAGYIEDETLAKIEKSHAGKATGESAFDLDGLSVSVKLFSLR
jgi:hypothetical protein